MFLENDEAETREEYDSGPWIASIRTAKGITYFPRNRSRIARHERFLPSGDVVVHDVHAGLVLRAEYYASADLHLRQPLGRPLGDAPIMKLQQSGSDWYVFTYQDEYDEADQMIRSNLRLIERHRGSRLEDTLELPRG